MIRPAALAFTLLLLACGPIGPLPGGRLTGEVRTEPVADWAFAEEIHTAQLETNPDDPHSVNIWIAGHGDSLYIATSMIAGVDDPSERAWVKRVQDDPRVRIRIDGLIYERTAVRVSDPTELAGARDMLVSKYEVERSEDGREQKAWVFRLDPR